VDNAPAAKFHFVDDDGVQVAFDAPFRRVISLYSVHTENLFALGASDALAGVQTTDVYPPEANEKPKYNYHGDSERVLAAAPDIVLIRPFIRRQNPDYFTQLEAAGIRVVSLYPKTLSDFDSYIAHLALLVGATEVARSRLAAFHQRLNGITELTSRITDKRRVFFESTADATRTAADGSLPAEASIAAGGVNIAAGAEPIRKGSSIASCGDENVLKYASVIDDYIVQTGPMDPTRTLAQLAARPGFGAVNAVRTGHVLFIDERIVSAPCFRYPDAVLQIAAFLYPNINFERF
jgi:iron complex transport system substrate-binding protein